MNSYVNTTTLQSINRANGKHEGDLQACCGALISMGSIFKANSFRRCGFRFVESFHVAISPVRSTAKPKPKLALERRSLNPHLPKYA